MLSNKLKEICLEYFHLYKRENFQIQLNSLHDVAKKASEKAKQNYKKIVEPKTCPIDVYISFWVKQVVMKDLATRGIRKISLNNPPSLFRASAKYFLLLPQELQKELNKRFFAVGPEKRKEVWQSFDLPLGELEKSLKGMMMERTKFAQKKGYSSYVDMFLDRCKISKSNYKQFIVNVDEVIEYCNQQLPKTSNLPSWFYSEFNLPCFMCVGSLFPFKNLDEAFNFVFKKYKVLDKYRNKIDIKLGENSEIFYKKETDGFEIIISKNINNCHQIVDLIHELAHVITYLKSFKRGINPSEKGAYWREKEALKIEIRILRKLKSVFLQNFFTEALLVFRRILFEIELYQNPNQNLSKLYAQTFNRCFKKANQQNNPLYILDEKIIRYPFSSLPHAIAQYQVVSGLRKGN